MNPIQYPIFKITHAPTPSDKLIICDHCGKAEWTMHSNLINHCVKCNARMREASPKEYNQAKLYLTNIN